MPTTVQSLVYPGIEERWVEPKYVMPLFETWNGSGSTPAMMTGILDENNWAMALRNRGTGGALNILDTLDAMLMEVTDAGTSLTNLFGSGTAAIDGATVLGDTLEVAGDTLLQATLGVVGNATFASAVGVGGTLHVVGHVGFESTLEVLGAAELRATLGVGGNATFASAVNVGGTLGVVGHVGFQSTLEVLGAAAFRDDVEIEGALAVTGPVTLDAAVTLGDAPSDVITVLGVLAPGTAEVPALQIGEPGTGAWWQAAGALNVALAGVGDMAQLNLNGLRLGTPLGSPISMIDFHVGAGGVALIRATVMPGAVQKGQLYWADGLGEWIFSGGLANTMRLSDTGVGWFDTTPAAQQTAAAAATDLPTAMALANALRAALVAYGLVAP